MFTLPDLSRAKTEETLLIMVKGACRRNGWVFGDTIDSYTVTAKAYRKSNPQAAALFTAAAARLQELTQPPTDPALLTQNEVQDGLQRMINEHQSKR